MSGASVVSVMGRAIRGFLRWYWKQAAAGMIVVAAIIPVAANYLLAQLGLSQANRAEVTTTLRLGLLVMAAAAYFWRGAAGFEPATQ